MNVSTSSTFSVQYGSGAAQGIVIHDTVTINKNISSSNQVMGLANNTQGMSGPSQSNEKASGILGLAFTALMQDPTQDVPFILNLLKNKVIKEPVFSIYLNRQGDYGYTGEIVIGGYETSRFTGQLNFLPLVTYDDSGKANIGTTGSNTGIHKYWTVPGQAIAMYDISGKQLYETKLDQLEPVILDTGTTLSYLPLATVIALLDRVTSNYTALSLNSGTIQAYQVNCLDFTRQHLWFDFQFSPSTSSFSTAPVIIRVPLNEMVLPQDTNNISTATTCLFGMAPISTGFLSSVGSGWILGQTVLRSAYVVHDMLGLQVGVGAAANGYHSPTFDDQQESNADVVTRSMLKLSCFVGFVLMYM